MEWTSPCRTLLCCVTWIFKRSISSCFSTSQTKTDLPARSFSSDFLRSSERTLYITFAPSSSNTFAICQATLFLFATPVTKKLLFSRSRKLIFCSPYKAVTGHEGQCRISRPLASRPWRSRQRHRPIATGGSPVSAILSPQPTWRRTPG